MTTPHIDVRQFLRTKSPNLAARLPAFVLNYLERLVHQDEVNHILRTYRNEEGVAFMQALLQYFDIRLEVTGRENLPATGRHIFASNHPLGGMDGICLCALLGEHYNGNILCPVNDLLLYIPNLQPLFIPVNKYGKQERSTAHGTTQAYASDRQILTFPAGFCSRKRKGKITDGEWKKSFIRKAEEHRRDVIPIHFDGRNSPFFYNLSSLRTFLGIRTNIELLYLPDEMFRSKHATFRIYIGKPIPWQTFTQETPRHWAEQVKQLSYALHSAAGLLFILFILCR
jgi:putative hemolysin